MKVDFTVNGKAVSVDVPADMPLLWILRDTLSLKGTKFGCGEGQCGACTVLIDGKPTRSCITEVGDCATCSDEVDEFLGQPHDQHAQPVDRALE